ncbi:MAG: hypothetical protein N2C14_13080 [Planctomycetales bacterium]
MAKKFRRLLPASPVDQCDSPASAANQLITEESAAGVTTYTHDAVGNRTEKDDPVAGTTFYEWDARNRLALAEPPAGAVSFTYSPQGRRVAKETPGETKKFIYDFKHLLQETDAADATQVDYTSSLEEFGDLLSQYDGADSQYHDFDGLGSTAALLNASQTSDADWRPLFVVLSRSRSDGERPAGVAVA